MGANMTNFVEDCQCQELFTGLCGPEEPAREERTQLSFEERKKDRKNETSPSADSRAPLVTDDSIPPAPQTIDVNDDEPINVPASSAQGGYTGNSGTEGVIRFKRDRVRRVFTSQCLGTSQTPRTLALPVVQYFLSGVLCSCECEVQYQACLRDWTLQCDLFASCDDDTCSSEPNGSGEVSGMAQGPSHHFIISMHVLCETGHERVGHMSAAVVVSLLFLFFLVPVLVLAVLLWAVWIDGSAGVLCRRSILLSKEVVFHNFGCKVPARPMECESSASPGHSRVRTIFPT